MVVWADTCNLLKALIQLTWFEELDVESLRCGMSSLDYSQIYLSSFRAQEAACLGQTCQLSLAYFNSINTLYYFSKVLLLWSGRRIVYLFNMASKSHETCGNCNEKLAKSEDYAICSICGRGLHLDTCSVKKQTGNSMNPAKQAAWVCTVCRRSKKGSTSSTWWRIGKSRST